jgi:hypothetical protein
MAGIVELLEDLNRVAAQFGVLAPEVLVGELARGVVELGVADLAVLGLLARLEVGQPWVLPSPGLAPLAAQRRGHEPEHEDEQQGAEQEGDQLSVRPATARCRCGRPGAR